MTTTIAPISKDHIEGLISSADGLNLEGAEAAAMEKFIKISTGVFSGLVDGKILCIWGVIPPTLLSDQAYLWLHTTPGAKEHQFTIVRRAQIEVGKLLKAYPKLVGHCEVGAEQSIRWLKWLGAKFGRADDGLVPFLIERQES